MLTLVVGFGLELLTLGLHQLALGEGELGREVLLGDHGREFRALKLTFGLDDLRTVIVDSVLVVA